MFQELGEAAAGQQGAGQDLVPGDEPLKLDQVVRGLGVGHELSDRDERCLVGHFHHRQPPPVGFGDQGRRNGVVRQADPEPDAHRARPLDLTHEPALLRGTLEPHPGGQDQFAAIEEPLRILLFGDGHPKNVLVPGGFGESGLGEMQGRNSQ